jgi:bifunctional DNA-binding transcriptional regulator/antitoxin component of YhaV-PrlF toxin-antitoxin module
MRKDTDIRKLCITGKTTHYITIPKSIVRILGWKKGTSVSIKMIGNRLLMKKHKEPVFYG